ncbi:hypothetical protein [Desertivirga brevis]|uniref:hypothetical protein n=1 Tax=Desertivirga brevis TaxID=2810310 RepID=UPI001A960DC5|nr:hypothetical protein [Pedobacter sp. SYSU D00873]
MIKRFFLTGIIFILSALYKPCFADDRGCAAAEAAVEAGELDPEDYADMYPYCGSDNNIDMPLDGGVPFLFMAAVLFGAVKMYKRQHELKENAGLDK